MARVRTARTMNCKRRLHQLLVIGAFCFSAPIAAAGEWSSVIKLERFSVALAGATTVGSLEGRPAGAGRSFTERSFDFSAAQPHAGRWLLDFTFRSAETGEPDRPAAYARVGQPVGFATSAPPVGEPRGNELLLRARYDF